LEQPNELNNEINALKRQIINLETELNKKELEIYEHLETIEHLEDTVMKLESLIPDEDESKKSKKQKAIDSKLVIDLEDRDKQIRNLKDRMGFLRKEKAQLQQELEKLKMKNSDSTVIRTESLRAKPPLQVLVSELQDKVNKYKSELELIKRESIDVSEFNNKLKEKEVALERRMAYSLQTQIDEQVKIIDSKNKELKDVIIENEKLRGKLEVLEVQINMKDQRIEELNTQLKKKKSKKKA
jgi:chromosome segregation protein